MGILPILSSSVFLTGIHWQAAWLIYSSIFRRRKIVSP
jgi:hypothetical protein